MGEIFKKLKSLGFEWKIINSYHIIVRQQNEQGVTIKVRCAHTLHAHTYMQSLMTGMYVCVHTHTTCMQWHPYNVDSLQNENGVSIQWCLRVRGKVSLVK